MNRGHAVERGRIEAINNRIREVLTGKSLGGGELVLIDENVSVGGKRLRPILLLLTAECFGVEMKQGLDAAVGIELLHNSSLVFDDIIDNELERRGRPCFHKLYGTGAAISIGLFLSAIGVKLLLDYDDAAIDKMVSQLLTELSEGEVLESSFADRISVSDYLIVSRLKSGSLFGAAAGIGSALAKNATSETDRLLNLGRLFGVAYQLADDIADAGRDRRIVIPEPNLTITGHKSILSEFDWLPNSADAMSSPNPKPSSLKKSILEVALERLFQMEREILRGITLSSFQSFTKHIFRDYV